MLKPDYLTPEEQAFLREHDETALVARKQWRVAFQLVNHGLLGQSTTYGHFYLTPPGHNVVAQLEAPDA